MEGLLSYVPRRTNALLYTKLNKYDELLHEIPEKSITTDESCHRLILRMGRSIDIEGMDNRLQISRH